MKEFVISWQEPSETFNNFFNANLPNPHDVLATDYQIRLVHNYEKHTTTIVFEDICDYTRFMLEWS